MQRTPPVTWVFPLLTLAVLAALGLGGRSQLPPQLEYRYPEVTEAQAEQALRRLDRQESGGWLDAVYDPRLVPTPDDVGLSVVDTGTALVFPQIGNGNIPGTTRFFQTTLVLINQTTNTADGSIEFYNDAGEPLVLTVNGTEGSAFPFSLPARQTLRFATSGQGALAVGWAHVHSSQPVGGTITFGIRDSKGRVYTDVGVEESKPGTEFMLFADMIGATRTGIAVSNPDSRDARVRFDLQDRNGALKATRERTLSPWGHQALFLDELFNGVAGIAEFEGSVVITSDRKIHGLTLRSTGDQLTSMPMVQPPAPGQEWSKIALPHVGDGGDAVLNIQTSLILFNNLDQAATGTVQFYRSSGEEMQVRIGTTTASVFNFNLGPGAVQRLVTSGTGELKTGFAVVSMDVPITGTALFSLFQGGALDTEVGVGTAPLQKSVSILADSLGSNNTGLAVAYPLPADAGASNRITLTLYDRNGIWMGSTDFTLTPFQHDARFLTQLFPNVAGIDEFDGRIDVSANQYVSILSLRQAGTKLTSMPNFQKRYGFAPTSSMAFAQNLAGQPSTLLWTLNQNSNDFALDSIRLTASELGVDTGPIQVGDRIGFGHFSAGSDSRTYELVCTAKGSLEFDLLEFGGDQSRVAGEGSLTGSPTGNLALDLQFLDKRPFTFLGSAVRIQFWVKPGLIRPPATARQVQVRTEFESVSTEADTDVRLKRATDQNMSFLEGDPVQANLYRVSPIFLRPGVVANLEGNHFGSTPVVNFLFEMFDQDTYQTSQVTVPVLADLDAAAGWSVKVPALVGSAPGSGFADLKSISVNNGQGAGNIYRAGTNFAPMFRLPRVSRVGGQATAFSFSFDQAAGQFGISRFQTGLFGVQCSFAGLAVGDLLGSGKSGSTDYELRVQTVAADEVIVDVIQAGGSSPFAKMTLQRFPGAPPETGLPSLGIFFEQVQPPVKPVLQQDRFKMTWTFTAPTITLPARGSPVQAMGAALSTPTTDSPHSGLLVDQDVVFAAE